MLFAFILAANWSSPISDIDPPTAHIETDAALALIVFFCGDLFRHSRTRCRWLSEDFCRAEHRHDSAHAFSLIVRLFGNLPHSIRRASTWADAAPAARSCDSSITAVF
jgi:F-type H+-transporting ATPase subunit a